MDNFRNFGNRGAQITPVCRDLLIINIIVFVFVLFFPKMNDILSMYFFKSPMFKPLQIVSHFFMHADVFHLFFNMFGLYSIGVMLEMIWGGKKFLLYYLLSALGAALIYQLYLYWDFQTGQKLIEAFVLNPTMGNLTSFCSKYTNADLSQLGTFTNEDVEGLTKQCYDALENRKSIPMVGASGAIYGLLVAVWFLNPNAEFYLYFIPIPIKAKYLIPAFLVWDLYGGLSRQAGDNVAHFAHIGGALTGAIILLSWYGSKLWKR
jgi:membrane associated rhomboid family serine protease